jgi:hypothetical protein
VLVRRQPWYEGPQAKAVAQSIATHDPNGETDAFGQPSHDADQAAQRNPWVTVPADKPLPPPEIGL